MSVCASAAVSVNAEMATMATNSATIIAHAFRLSRFIIFVPFFVLCCDPAILLILFLFVRLCALPDHIPKTLTFPSSPFDLVWFLIFLCSGSFATGYSPSLPVSSNGRHSDFDISYLTIKLYFMSRASDDIIQFSPINTNMDVYFPIKYAYVRSFIGLKLKYLMRYSTLQKIPFRVCNQKHSYRSLFRFFEAQHSEVAGVCCVTSTCAPPLTAASMRSRRSAGKPFFCPADGKFQPGTFHFPLDVVQFPPGSYGCQALG